MIFVLFLAQWKITREYAIAKYYNLIAYVSALETDSLSNLPIMHVRFECVHVNLFKCNVLLLIHVASFATYESL